MLIKLFHQGILISMHTCVNMQMIRLPAVVMTVMEGDETDELAIAFVGGLAFNT